VHHPVWLKLSLPLGGGGLAAEALAKEGWGEGEAALFRGIGNLNRPPAPGSTNPTIASPH